MLGVRAPPLDSWPREPDGQHSEDRPCLAGILPRESSVDPEASVWLCSEECPAFGAGPPPP